MRGTLLAILSSILLAVAPPVVACTPRDFIVYFATSSTHPTANTRDAFLTVIDEVASSAKHATRIRIIGHTDGVGSALFNMELSRRRAVEVGALLISRGVSPAKIELQARGETAPAVAAGEFSETLNRRTEFVMEWDRVASGPLGAHCGPARPLPPG